jgi:hypothetical protein
MNTDGTRGGSGMRGVFARMRRNRCIVEASFVSN